MQPVALEKAGYVEQRRERLLEILTCLVGRASENRAPWGEEGLCQEYIAGVLGGAGWQPRLYALDEVAGLREHPLYWPGREYRGRPNVVARRRGSGGGRSLLLSGHVDTVPVGAAAWRHDPFGATVEGNRLYGRGACDMKAGLAAHLLVVEALSELGVRLGGDLIFESVVDEEFGGVNGTLAGRLAGFRADAAIVGEPSGLRVCPAQRGGRTVHLTFSAPNGGILAERGALDVVEQLRVFLGAVPEFAAMRRRMAPVHPLYAGLADPVPVTVARIQTAAWGTSEPSNVPASCQVELFWQTMPGETCETVDAQFGEWLAGVFPEAPEVSYPIRWLPGSAMGADTELVRELTATVERTLGRVPVIAGIEGPCDLFVFHELGIPAVLWGPQGGNIHMPDEYVEIDSLVESTQALLEFVCSWCGEED